MFIRKVIQLGQFKPDPLVPIQQAPSKEVFERVLAQLGDV
jgi:hypothetical protein